LEGRNAHSGKARLLLRCAAPAGHRLNGLIEYLFDC
jgi:hypothetical protein